MIVHVQIHGKVQGVFFRKSAKIEADRLGITGWIKNLEDGSVEATVSGTQQKLKEFTVWCKHGPPFAEVEKVEETWSDEEDNWEGFEMVN